eukprot:2994769-Rhodomonas_salina.1
MRRGSENCRRCATLEQAVCVARGQQDAELKGVHAVRRGLWQTRDGGGCVISGQLRAGARDVSERWGADEEGRSVRTEHVFFGQSSVGASARLEHMLGRSMGWVGAWVIGGACVRSEEHVVARSMCRSKSCTRSARAPHQD